MTSDATHGAGSPLEHVVIVGGGPAGLACAATLLRHSAARLTIVDNGHALGGQYWRHPAPSTAPDGIDPAEVADLHHDLERYERLVAAVEAGVSAGRVEVLLRHEAWTATALAGPRFAVEVAGALSSGEPRVATRTLVADRLVLATGAHDRALPFPGWDLPGVMTAGGLQALLKSGGVAPGRRVVIAGTGPFLLPVAAGLAQRGAKVLGVYEANSGLGWLSHAGVVAQSGDKLREGLHWGKELARLRIPVHRNRVVTQAFGGAQVEAVTIGKVDRRGRAVPGSGRRVATDLVGLGWGFSTRVDLAVTLGAELRPGHDGSATVVVDEMLRASVPGLFAAGEVTGVGGAALAVAEGRLAGLGIAMRTGTTRQDLRRARRLGAEVSRLRRFAAAMHRSHPVPSGMAELMHDATVVCRCEEVTAAAVRSAISEHAASSVREVKGLTRAGMGWCQGRVCGPAVCVLLGQTDLEPTERLVATPVPLGALADAVPHVDESVVEAETPPH